MRNHGMSKYFDKKNPTPAYFQIEKDLRERISRQEWSQDDSLPSEQELANQYKVSRVTIRQALQILEEDGIIIKRRGLGSFLTGKQPKPHIKNMDYSVVHQSSSDDTPSIQAKIIHRKNGMGLPVFFTDIYPYLSILSYHYIERIFYLKNKPIALSKSWINLSIAPSIDHTDLVNNSISYTLKEHFDIDIAYVDDYINSVKPIISEREILNIDYDTSLLAINGISYTHDDTVVEISTTYWIGTEVGFKLRLNQDNF